MKLIYEPMVKLGIGGWMPGGEFSSIEQADIQLQAMIEYYKEEYTFTDILEIKIAVKQ